MKLMRYLILIVMVYCFTYDLSAQSGGTWVDQNSGTINLLTGVSAVSDDTVFACGAGGTFLKTTNGGAQWISVSSGSAEDYYSIDFINGTTGFVVGNNGSIRKTNNGGVTWIPSWLGSAHMRCVRYIDSLVVFVGGSNGIIAKSTDGGTNWTMCASGTTATIYDIFFISPLKGFAVCFDGSVLHSQDGGFTWSGYASGVSTKLNQIHFTDSLNGVLTGSNGVIRKSTDGGLTWNTVSAPGNMEDIGGLEFPDPLHGFCSGAVPSVTGTIMETIDGGITWDTVYTSAISLTGMDFANANTGYVVGYNGKILKYTTATGMNETEADGYNIVKLFPNPVTDFLNISFDSADREFVHFELFNLYGAVDNVFMQNSYSENNRHYKLNVSHLPSGVYFVRVNGSLNEVHKFVKY